MPRGGGSKHLVALLALLLLLPVSASAAFNRPLSLGSTGPDVVDLQTILKEKGFYTFPEITGYYGQITLQAVADFQKSVGLDSLGYVGPATRAILNGTSVGTSTVSVPILSLGSRGPEVGVLQQFLKTKGFFTYPEITSYFGVITEAALKAFQAANSLIASGTTDEPTRTKIAEQSTFTATTTATSTATSTGPRRHRGGGGGGNDIPVPGDSTPPAVPTGFSIDSGDAEADLEWTDPVDSDLSYISIYRGTTSGNLTLLATTSPGVEEYTDSPLTNGDTYYYALSATDANENESDLTTEEDITLETYFELASDLFDDTGRVAVWPDASNIGTGLTGQVGSNRNANEWGPLVGSPIYIVGREMSDHTWLGYEITTLGSVADQFINHVSQSIYRPAKFIRWDAGVAVADNGSGGSAALPLDASGTNTIRFRLNTLDTQATDLAAAVVYQNNNINKLATVSISGASSGSVAPNLLHTATQAVADGWLSSTALVSNGGTISDGAYVMATNPQGRRRLGNSGFQSVPLASELTPDDYTITITVSTVGTYGESSGTSRAYIGGLFYHSDNITETTPGAYMARMGYVSASTDGSTDETFYMNGRPVASGSNREIGKGHGNETRTEQPHLLVDGVAYVMEGKSTSRARASNVATIKTALPHGLTTGDVLTMSGFGSSGYSANEVSITVADATTFTYANTGSNESETVDTAGRFIRKGIKLGSSSIELSQASNLFHQDYLSGNTPIGNLTTTYTLSDKVFTTEAEGSIGIDFRHAGSLPILASYWSGSPSTKGPVYPGAATAKAYSPNQAEAALNNNNDSNVLSGQSLIFALSRSSSDLASIIEITSMVGDDVFAGDWLTYLQDRTGGNVEKIYHRVPGAGTKDVSAGWTFDYATNRIDGLAPSANNSDIFTD